MWGFNSTSVRFEKPKNDFYSFIYAEWGGPYLHESLLMVIGLYPQKQEPLESSIRLSSAQTGKVDRKWNPIFER